MAQKPEYKYCPKGKTYKDYLKEAAARDPENYTYYTKKFSKKQKESSLIINHL